MITERTQSLKPPGKREPPMVPNDKVKIEFQEQRAGSGEPSRMYVYVEGELEACVVARVVTKESSDDKKLYSCVSFERVSTRMVPKT